MKKFIAMLLALALVTPFSLGCGDKKKTEVKKETKEVKDTDKDDSTQTKTTVDEKSTTVKGDPDDTDPTKK